MPATNYPNLIVLEASSADALLAILKQLNAPYDIVSMYSDGSKHYAWVSSLKKFRFETKTKE